jgi:NitT/TauT family transport system substrate-binding protein
MDGLVRRPVTERKLTLGTATFNTTLVAEPDCLLDSPLFALQETEKRSSNMLSRRNLIVSSLAFLSSSQLAFAETVVRIATLKTGTVAWEVDTMIANGLDKKHGFALSLVPVGGKQSADVMLAGGEADVIVSDWIWVSRQRNQGADYTFTPYSRQVGSIIVKGDSAIKALADLKGKKIGVAGGPTDKSWILFQALAAKDFGFDLAKDSEPVFAAPPLLSEQLEGGEIDALITFWHLAAKQRAKGARDIASVADAAKSLGLDTETPLLGYVYSEKWSKAKGDVAAKLAAASAEAKALLATSDAEWDRLKPLMNVKSDTEFQALKDGFRAGIPKPGSVNVEGAKSLFAVLGKIGGTELVGDKPDLAPGTFAGSM